MALAALVCIVPFYYILLTAFKDSRVLFDYPPKWIPDLPLYLGNYQHLLENTLSRAGCSTRSSSRRW